MGRVSQWQGRIEGVEAKRGSLQSESEMFMVTLKDYNVANKRLERKLEGEELSNTAFSREFRRMQDQLAEVKMENNVLQESTEEMIASALSEKKMQPKSCDKILERTELEFAGLVMKVSRTVGVCRA